MWKRIPVKEFEQNSEVNNWLAAIVLNFSFINGIMGIAGASLVTIAVILFLCILSIKEKKFIIYPSAVVIIGFILICFLISFFRVKDITSTFLYLRYFLVFGIVSFIVGLQDINIDKVVTHMSRIGLAGIIIWISRNGYLLEGFSSDDSPHLMGLSYAILPLLFGSVIGLSIDFRTRLISIINIVLVMYIYQKVAPRGIWIAVAFFFATYCFFILSKIKNVRCRILIKFFILSLAFIALIAIFNNFTEIILGISDFLSSRYGLKIYALDKYASYLNKGNVLNGRGEIWGNAMRYIQENLIIGKGIGYFESQGDGGYAHNILLQVMCEGGIFLLLPIVSIVLWSLRIFLCASNKSNKSEYLFFSLAFSCGIVILFYSSVHWIYIPFWFFLGYFWKTILVKIKNSEIRIKI